MPKKILVKSKKSCNQKSKAESKDNENNLCLPKSGKNITQLKEVLKKLDSIKKEKEVMEIPKISEEQNNIIDKLKDNNVIVDSVAGSGKTTTNLYIAKYFGEKNILLLTYNSKLKIETREKVKLLEIKNLETHSFHSFCVKYYDNECYTDTKVKHIIVNDIKNKGNISYDLIILDEAQDITKLFYELICKINKDNKKIAKICILGDKYQSIYDFNNADERYIIYGDELFNFNNLFWNRCTLSVSFRVTDKIADFINNCMLGTNRIKANKNSISKPTYIICNVFPDKYDIKSYKPYVEIKKYLNLGYKPEEIFILAPSLKSLQCPVRLFENYLKSNEPDIPIYVPSSDDEKLDDSVIKNKLIFSTFHQAKGLERKIVIIFGFDNGYFKYYKQNQNTLICPNELYVATTRASNQLIMIHHYSNDYLPFINQKKLNEYADVYGGLGELNSDKIKNEIDIQVTHIVKHLPQDVIDKCIYYLDIKNIREANDDNKINIPHKIKNGNLYESVSEINGIAIPSLFEYQKNKEMSILNYCLNPDASIFDSKNKPLKDFWEKEVNKIKEIKENETIKDNLLYISTVYNSLSSQYIFKSYQIYDFKWLSDDILNECLIRFESLKFTQKAKMEVSCILSNNKSNDAPEILNRKICGRYDCLDGDNIYEFKCTEKLEKEHYLQLAIYMYMHKMNIFRENKENKNKIISDGKKNLEIGNEVRYNINNLDKIGFITKIYKNGNINVKKNINAKKTCETDKINKDNIINNISYENSNKVNETKTSQYFLYNVLTDQLDEISCDLDKLKKMIEFLFYSKFINNKELTDEEFKNEALLISNKYKVVNIKHQCETHNSEITV